MQGHGQGKRKGHGQGPGVKVQGLIQGQSVGSGVRGQELGKGQDQGKGLGKGQESKARVILRARVHGGSRSGEGLLTNQLGHISHLRKASILSPLYFKTRSNKKTKTKTKTKFLK